MAAILFAEGSDMDSHVYRHCRKGDAGALSSASISLGALPTWRGMGERATPAHRDSRPRIGGEMFARVKGNEARPRDGGGHILPKP